MDVREVGYFIPWRGRNLDREPTLAERHEDSKEWASHQHPGFLAGIELPRPRPMTLSTLYAIEENRIGRAARALVSTFSPAFGLYLDSTVA